MKSAAPLPLHMTRPTLVRDVAHMTAEISKELDR